MAASPVSDNPSDSAFLPFSDTVRKVDRAVARLEELQCMVRCSRSNAAYAKRSPPICRSKLALHADNCLPYKNTGNAQHASSSKPALRITCGNREQGQQHVLHVRSSKSNGLPVAISRRSARVGDVPNKQVISSPADTPMALSLPSRMQSPPDMPLSSPPSSACSSSVQVVTRRVRVIKDTAPSKLPRTYLVNAGPADPNAVHSKLPRTFVVHAGPANPNRPWCLSTSPSPATTSSTTSNYIYSPSSNSSVPLSTKYPSRFSPLHHQISGRKSYETLQSQPLLCKSPECANNKPIKASPNRPQKMPWFGQTRLSLPSLTASSPSTKRPTRRFSLTSNKHRDSPPRPLPALITRLPTRRKKVLSPDKKQAASPKRKMYTSAGSTPNASPQGGQTMIRRSTSITLQSPSKRSTSPPIPQLPLPPALQARSSSTQHLPRLMKASHKRSSSCPRQCLMPLADGAANVNQCDLSSPPVPAKHTKRACFQSTGKENCFSGCGPAAWPCLRRSWSFSQQPSLEHAGPNHLRHAKGYMQNEKNMDSQSQVYKVDSFSQEPNRDQRNLYIG